MTLRRTRIPELMDDPGLDRQEHLRALRGLARLNRWSRADAILWPGVRRLLRADRALRLLDVATGSADVPLALARRAVRMGRGIEIEACDVSPRALDAARAAAGAITLRAHVVDATAQDLPGGADVATCSLFLHHLDPDAVVAVLRRMASAAPTVLVSDLRRCRRGLGLAWVAGRALSRSPVVHADSVRSVRAAYTPEELADFATTAGLRGFAIRRVWPFRMLLSWTASTESRGREKNGT